MNKESTDQYWSIVQQCLQKIHALQSSAATECIAEFRDDIEKMVDPDVPMTSELIYHNEPFSLAYDLAGGEETYNAVLEKHKGTYHTILVAHGWAEARNEGNSTHRRGKPTTYG